MNPSNIEVYSFKGRTDQIYVYLDLPSPIWPFENPTVMVIESATGKGSSYSYYHHIVSKYGHYNEKIAPSFYMLFFCGQVYSFFLIDNNLVLCEEDIILESNKRLSFRLKKEGSLSDDFRYIRQNTNQFHIKYNSPIILMIGDYFDKSEIEINPNLHNLKCEKIIPPAQAFQEIEMYLMNVLVSDNKDTIKIDSKYREGSRFDKWSFRKLPSKSK